MTHPESVGGEANLRTPAAAAFGVRQHELDRVSPDALRQMYHNLQRQQQELMAQNEAQCRSVRDLTERLGLMEAECDHLKNQLSQAQKMEVLGTLAGGIAHDFNNTLAIILRFTEVSLRQLPMAVPLRGNLQEILTAAHRAKELVQHILVFSRQHSPGRSFIRLQQLVDETLTWLRGSLPATIDIRSQVKTTDDIVLADPTQLQQVIMNLCSNAEYAMRPSGGVLELILDTSPVPLDVRAACPDCKPGPYVRLAVRDTGTGIPADELPRIFELFFTTKAPGDGTGMGLAVVQGIVTSHEGGIKVKSVLGEGTTFEIYLPQQVGTVAAHVAVDEPPAGQGHILFVDDEEGIARATQILLTDLGYEVSIYTNGCEALAAFCAAPSAIDLVIADQTMPQLTGTELVSALRAQRSDIPIILCTGYSHLMNDEQAAAQGIDAFLMKPVDIYDLAATIRQVLAQSHGGGR